jgi:HPt (histidine-containing phosphotransfer) domain-containing protein
MTIANSVVASAGHTPVLKMELLDQFRGRKNNLLERLINAFLQEAPGFFQNIRKAGETGNLSDLRLNAHALKSCSYNLGAVRLSKICQDLETAAVEQNAGNLKSAMQQIGPEWFEAEQALIGELYTIKAPRAAQQPATSVDEDWY